MLKEELRELGISHDNDQIFLRRVLYRDGKSKAFISDTPVTVGLLKKIGSDLLEIHGQNEKIGLLVIEVKGGNPIECNPIEGKWYTTTRSGNRYEIKHPAKQAKNRRFVRRQTHRLSFGCQDREFAGKPCQRSRKPARPKTSMW